MPESLINSSNALRATQYLLALDTAAIDEIYQTDAYDWVEALKAAYGRYQNHLQKHYLVMYAKETREELVQHCLDSLTLYAASVALILTPEAKEKLVAYLADPEAPLPIEPL